MKNTLEENPLSLIALLVVLRVLHKDGSTGNESEFMLFHVLLQI